MIVQAISFEMSKQTFKIAFTNIFNTNNLEISKHSFHIMLRLQATILKFQTPFRNFKASSQILFQLYGAWGNEASRFLAQIIARLAIHKSLPKALTDIL